MLKCTDVQQTCRGLLSRYFLQLLPAYLMVAMTCGCSITDEGAVTYRKAENTTMTVNDASQYVLVATKAGGMSKPLLPLRLVKEDLGTSEAAIRDGDSITVRLRHVYVNYCMETPFSPQRLLSNYAIFRPNCEEAVLVNAFEMSHDRPFLQGKQARDDARVIFYSDDVEGGSLLFEQTGQNLNAHNMPIYGPITYHGAPFALDLFMLELDVESPEIKAVLQTLASLGSIAYPPASPALGVLNTVGSALLDGEQDDTDFRYSLVLDPYPDSEVPTKPAEKSLPGGTRHAWLEEGSYVFLREQNRQATTCWAALFFDDNTGKLFRKKSVNMQADGVDCRVAGDPVQQSVGDSQAEWEEYRDNSYIVLQVLKNMQAKDIDQDQVKLSAFRETLQQAAEKNAANSESF